MLHDFKTLFRALKIALYVFFVRQNKLHNYVYVLVSIADDRENLPTFCEGCRTEFVP